jgi:murein DD-endopeptidase MepM/ murein hydrolase activator NlpD
LRDWIQRRLRRSKAAPPEPWVVEAQLHPAGARSRVRYLFLTRRQLTFWSVLALIYILALCLACAVAPGVVGGLVNRREYYVLAGERAAQGKRLRALVDQWAGLEQRMATLDLRKRKILFVYGLERMPGLRPAPPPPASTEVEQEPSIYTQLLEQGERKRQRIEAGLVAFERALRLIGGYEATHAEEVRATPSICPLRGRDFVLFSPFGNRRSPFTGEPELHAGIDLAAPVGSAVHAAADGRVVFAGQSTLGASAHWFRMGNLVVVDHGRGFFTLYGHLDQIGVRVGTDVRRGQILGTVGNSGWSRSPHLHYEIRRPLADGTSVPVEPLLFILDRTWPNEEPRLLQARRSPPPRSFEALPHGRR